MLIASHVVPKTLKTCGHKQATQLSLSLQRSPVSLAPAEAGVCPYGLQRAACSDETKPNPVKLQGD